MEKVVYKDGIHEISNSEYHASAGISRSMLMEFKRSPYHYWYKYVSGLAVKEESTPAMDLGNAVHTLVLEESKFDEEFYITHQQRKPNKGTPAHDKMIKAAGGRIILTNEAYLQAVLMAKSVKSNPEAAKLLQGCVIERSIYFTHIKSGLQAKARPDAMCGSVVLDLKTTADARLKSFQSSALNYGYFLQGAIVGQAIQSIGQTMEHFVCLPVEKTAPFCTGVYIVDCDAIEYGVNQFDTLMTGLAKCLETDIWPGYGIQSLELPGWAKYDDILEIE